jgi:hypothetical protein
MKMNKKKCGKNIDQSRKKLKNTHKYTKHLTKKFEMHYKYITKVFLNFFPFWQEGKLGCFLIFIFPRKHLSLGGENSGNYPILMFKLF